MSGHGYGHMPPDPLDAEELRQRLQAVVSGVQPTADALDRIRGAIPVRRRRRRVAASVVAVLLIVGGGAGAVAGTTGSSPVASQVGSTTPGMSSSAASVGTGDETASPHAPRGTGGRFPGGHTTTTPRTGPGSTATSPTTPTEGSIPPTSGVLPPVGGAPTTATTTAAPPQACPASSLHATVSVGTSTPAYGKVEVTTTSTVPCIISGPPVVTVTDGSGNAGTVMEVTSSPPTAAPQLTPAAKGGSLLLAAGGTYDFRFAWAAASTAGPTATPCAVPTGATGTSTSWQLAYTVPSSSTASPSATGASGGTTLAASSLPQTCGAATLYYTNVEPVTSGSSPMPTGG